MNEDDIVGLICGALFCGGSLFVVLWSVLLRGIFIIEPRTAHVLFYWGKYSRTLSEPGLHFVIPIGLVRQIVSTRDTVLQIPLTTVVEQQGNPIQVSAVAVYRVSDPARAIIDIQGYQRFVANQASAVLKTVCAHYPYESRDARAPSLKKESDEIIEALKQNLQEQVKNAGIEVVLVRLNDLTYAPEISQSMLLRQQAQAMVDARRTLVEGAVETTTDALERLEGVGLHLSHNSRMRLATSLTLLLCAGDRGDHHSTVVTRGARPGHG
jgi:regulator of protease activity HflC (stomatin/prohibitin superfamily)